MNLNCKLYYYLSWFEGSTVNRNRLYSQIWKSKAPHRSKAFMWLVGNDALLTNFVRKKRNLTVNDSCFLCGVTVETTLHALRDCSKAKEMWNSVGISCIN